MRSIWKFHNLPDDIQSCDDAIRDCFIIALGDLIKEGDLQGSTSFLKQDMDSRSSLLQAVIFFITETDTPLFLVLDDIGTAFAHESLTPLQQRKYFFKPITSEMCPGMIFD